MQRGEQVDLTQDEQAILSLDSDFAQRFQNAMKPLIDTETAKRMGMTNQQYAQYVEDVDAGMDMQRAYENQILPAAKAAGYVVA